MKLLEKFRAASKKAVAARNDLQVAVEELRTSHFELGEERQRVEGAPMTREETAARIARHLDILEAEARERLAAGSFRTPISAAHVVADADAAFRIRGASTGLMAFAGTGALCAIGLRHIIEPSLLAAAMAEVPGDGITESERAAQLRRIKSDIAAIERAEEALIREAETAGIVVHRRRDARPEIFLAEEV